LNEAWIPRERRALNRIALVEGDDAMTPAQETPLARAKSPPRRGLSKTVIAVRAAFEEFGVEPANPADIAPARDFALRLIGGRMATTRTIARIHRGTGVGLFVVRDGDRICGLLAFIMLNEAGAEAAVRDDFDSLSPRARFVAAPDEEPAAIYSWAIAAADKETAQRLIRGHERLRHVAAAHLPFYCRLATEQGRRLGIVRMGFQPLPGSQSGLFWSAPRAQSLVEAAA
jgi:hypothetical protein